MGVIALKTKKRTEINIPWYKDAFVQRECIERKERERTKRKSERKSGHEWAV